MKSKFKTGERVKVIANDTEQQFKGKIGTVKKVYRTFCDPKEFPDGLYVYRIEVDGVMLRGVALESYLEKA